MPAERGTAHFSGRSSGTGRWGDHQTVARRGTLAVLVVVGSIDGIVADLEGGTG